MKMLKASSIRIAALSAVALLILTLSSCHATKSAETKSGGDTAVAEQTSKWSDVYIPVKVELTEPSRMSISGRATMVRDRSVYLSLRMLGMEVATVYIDADSIFATEKLHKQMLAVGYEATVGNRLTIGQLQDVLLGCENAATGKLPAALTYSVEKASDGSSTAVTLSTTLNGKKYSGRITWDMASAQYDTGSPRQWSRPSGYTIIDPAKLPALLKSF
jgi:hypothetical protein